jgi:hypothetical protein
VIPSKFHIPATVSEIDLDLPTVAIDLSGAYAEIAQKKTGYSQPQWLRIGEKTGPCSQAEAAEWFTTSLSAMAESGAKSVNLILEAPLSYAFAPNPEGIPLNAQRRPVERKTNYLNPELINDDRPWIRNAGAATALVALLFLKEIRPRIPDTMIVNLFEGFWSWIDTATPHQDDVKGLIKGFRQGHIVPALNQSTQNFQTALQLLGETSEHAVRPPFVVFGHPALAEAYKPTDH